MATASIPAVPGEKIAGKYQIERVIGTGGVGMVVAARHLTLGQTVALKFLLPGAAHDQSDVRRFEREAQSAVQLKGEHVCRVYDVGELDDGSPFIVLEYLEGKDLGQILREQGPLPIVEAVGYLLQVCEAVAEAHSLGMVHRDLKPSNFFLTHRHDGLPLVKVLDFGIAKYKIELEQQDVSLTQTRALLGSPVYMSPEQVRSARSVDQRSDIWSLGVCLFELLTDMVPFGGETVTGVAAAVSTDPVPPVTRYRPETPQGLEAVIEKCLEKNRERRYQNVAELAEDLVPFGPSEATYSLYRISGTVGVKRRTGNTVLSDSYRSREVTSTSQSTQTSADYSVASTPALPAQKRPWHKPLVIGMGAVLVAVGLAAAWLNSRSSAALASRDPRQAAPSVVPALRNEAPPMDPVNNPSRALPSAAPEISPVGSPAAVPQPHSRDRSNAAAVNRPPVDASKAIAPKTTAAKTTAAKTTAPKKAAKKSSTGGSLDDIVDTRH